jgi:hypothetical protein
MKVKELIEQLQALDPDMETMRHGYEGGVENVSSLNIKKVALKVHPEWYYGSHETIDEDNEYPGHEHITAVIIS